MLEDNCIKKTTYFDASGSQHIDYCMPIIGHIDKTNIEGEPYDIKTLRYFDECKDDDNYTVIYTVSFPKSIDDTIFYPVRCGKKCGICRDKDKKKGNIRRKLQKYMREEVNEL